MQSPTLQLRFDRTNGYNLPLANLIFDNGYSASVVKEEGLGYEVAVIFDDLIVYDTPITGDVVRPYGLAELDRVLCAIRDLEEPCTQ